MPRFPRPSCAKGSCSMPHDPARLADAMSWVLVKKTSISTVLLLSCFLSSAALAEEKPSSCSRTGSVVIGAVIGTLPAIAAGIFLMLIPTRGSDGGELSGSAHDAGIVTLVVGIPFGALLGGVIGYAVSSCRSTSASTGTRNNNSLLGDETHFVNLRNQQGTPGPRFVLPILSYGF